MAVAVGTLFAAHRIEVKRLRVLQVSHVLRDDGQIVKQIGYARMIVAEHASINVQGAFVGLLRQLPLLLACVDFRQIVEHRCNIGWRQRNVASRMARLRMYKSLACGYLTLLVAEQAKRPE